MTIVISSALLLSILVQLGFWGLFQRLYFFKSPPLTDVKQGISIIVSVKNGASYLQDFMHHILEQSYPTYEVLLIDDFSTDNTLKEMKKYAGPGIKVHSAAIDLPGKKQALSEGIKHARYDWLLFTDVDCIPHSKNWIESMVQHQVGSDVVLGYGPLRGTMGVISLFSSFETAITAIQYFNYALYRYPYMGVGRNLLVDKTSWMRAGGYASHTDIASGDDDLLIQDIASIGKSRISINTDRKSYMYSPTMESLQAFLSQKQRHISTSTRYTWLHKGLLALYSSSHMLIYGLLLVLSFINPYQALYWFLSYIITKWLLSILPFLKLNEGSKLIWFPILDALLVAYYLIMVILMPLRKTESWN